MSTICFFNIRKVYDELAMETYRSRVMETVSPFQGKFLVLGGSHETKEGNWHPSNTILIEFPSLELANAWYHSKVYGPLKNLRITSVDSDAVFFNGL